MADGVSTCENGKAGAEIACQTIMKIMLENWQDIFKCGEAVIAKLVVRRIVDNINNKAMVSNENVRSYASTLSFACFNKSTKKVLTFTLGDSLAYKLSEKGCILLNQPDAYDNGKCCVTTTDYAFTRAKINIVEAGGLNGVMLCSDGAWRMFYKENTFRDDLWDAIKKQNYEAIKAYLQEQDNCDDSSFIIMDLSKIKAA